MEISEMEKVLVVSTELITPYLGEESFITENISEIVKLAETHHMYIDREYAENAREYKQIIPYAVLLNESQIFLTQRLKAQTEKRLHGRCSIGLGGHINPSEETARDCILEGMKRELYEEVGLEDIVISECAGVINDMSTEVSNYHIGLVYFLRVSEDIQIKEVNKMTGKWIMLDKLSTYYNMLESWSQIVWDARDKWNVI